MYFNKEQQQQQGSNENRVNRWKFSKRDKLKINCDVAFNSKIMISQIAFIYKNFKMRNLQGRSKKKIKSRSVVVVEALAVRKATI